MTDCATQLWSQLCLDASLTIINSNKFLISLSTQSSSNAYIRPPRWVSSMCIQDIDMSFHFSTCRRTRIAFRAPVTVFGGCIQHTLASTTITEGHLDRRYHSPLSSLGRPQDTLTDKSTPWTLYGSSVGTSPVSSQDSISSNTHSTSSLGAPTTRHRYATQEVKVETLVQIVDSSLRRIISDNKPVRSGGIVLSSDAGCPKLATISPALFSPGYIKVRPINEFYDAADGLTLGDFSAYCPTAHDSTHCISGI